jgi:hypothetical protein
MLIVYHIRVVDDAFLLTLLKSSKLGQDGETVGG